MSEQQEWMTNGVHVYCGDYAAEGEPDAWITVEAAESPEDLARRIALALNADGRSSDTLEGEGRYEYRVVDRDGRNAVTVVREGSARNGVVIADRFFPKYGPHRLQRRAVTEWEDFA